MFSAPEFTLSLNLASLWAVEIITVFLLAVSLYEKLFTVEAGYNDAFSKEIFASDVFGIEACDEILFQLCDCYME